MPFLSYAHILELQQQLEGTRARVICAGSDEYAESIKRWSDTCEKEAVRITLTLTKTPDNALNTPAKPLIIIHGTCL